MECIADKNVKDCSCTYSSCSKRGKCCLCVQYHRKKGELPGCFFPPEIEATYDRSVKAFIKASAKKPD